MRFPVIVICILLTLDSVSNAITVPQFKQLALTLVDDLEKEYGASFSDVGVMFDMNAYRDVIERTDVILNYSEEKIVNAYFIKDETGADKKVLELVDAINYFPGQLSLELHYNTWKEKFDSQKWTELKLMIHHEFVPFFTKASDRQHKFSNKVKTMYDAKVSLSDIRPGMYKVVSFGDPLFETITNMYWYNVSYSKLFNRFTLTLVENPLKNIWCFNCYAAQPLEIHLSNVTPGIAMIAEKNISLELSKVLGGLSDAVGRPYLRMLSRSSFGMGYMDSEYKGPITEFVKQKNIDTKVVVFTRVENVADVNWNKEKVVPLFNYRFLREKSDCQKMKAEMVLELARLCPVADSRLGIDLTTCKSENVKITDMKETAAAPLFKSHQCALFGTLYPIGRPPITPGHVSSTISHKYQIWQRMMELHKDVIK